MEYIDNHNSTVCILASYISVYKEYELETFICKKNALHIWYIIMHVQETSSFRVLFNIMWNLKIKQLQWNNHRQADF